jgi:hypothetical protein
MAIDAINQGHAAQAGTPTSGMNTSATTPEPIEISVVVESGSNPTLIRAFQPAWQAAANKTARKTIFSITRAYQPLVPLAPNFCPVSPQRNRAARESASA